MKVKKAFNNTTVTAASTTVDIKLDVYPFTDVIQAYVEHNQTGGTKGVKIYGRLHPSLSFQLLNNITNTSTTKWYTITPCAEYRVEINNTGGGSMTASCYLMR